MNTFYCDSTLRFCSVRGFGESYYILCPVCGNSGILITTWEDGSIDEEECSICKRTEDFMEMPRF